MGSLHENGRSTERPADAERVYCGLSVTERPERVKCEYRATDSNGLPHPHFDLWLGQIYLSLGTTATCRLFEALREALEGAELA